MLRTHSYAIVPVLVAVVALLGEQGARVGSVLIPDLGLGWAVVALAAMFLAIRKRDDRQLTRRHAAIALGFALSFVALGLVGDAALSPPLSLDVRFDDGRTVTASSLQLEARRELARLSGRRRNVTLSTEGVLEVPRTGEYRFEIDCDDSCRVTVAGTEIHADEAVALEAGDAPFTLVYRQLGGPARLLFGWNRPGAIELLPMEHFLRAPSAPPRRRGGAHAALALSVLWWTLLAHLGRAHRAVPRTDLRAPPRPANSSGVHHSLWVPASLRRPHRALGRRRPLSQRLASELQLLQPRERTRRSLPCRRPQLSRSGRDILARDVLRSVVPRAVLHRDHPPVPVKLAGGELGILVQSFFFSCATLDALPLRRDEAATGWWWATALLTVPIVPSRMADPRGADRISDERVRLLLCSASCAVTFVTSSAMPRASVACRWGGRLILCLIRLSALSVVVAVAGWSSSSPLPKDASGFRYALAFGVALTRSCRRPVPS